MTSAVLRGSVFWICGKQPIRRPSTCFLLFHYSTKRRKRQCGKPLSAYGIVTKYIGKSDRLSERIRNCTKGDLQKREPPFTVSGKGGVRMRKNRINALFSPNYRNRLYHRRHLLLLHFNLDLPLYPFCFEDQIRDAANAWYDSPGVNFLMLVALEEGESIYEINGKKYTVSPGKVLFVPEFTPYLFRSGTQTARLLYSRSSQIPLSLPDPE